MAHLDTILHLEDEENDVFFFERTLKRVGFKGRYQSVPDGVEGMNYLLDAATQADRDSTSIPDLIVCDIKMPKMNGFEFLRWLRTHPAFARIPAVVLTSSYAEFDQKEAVNVGANACLVKGVSPRDWEELVRGLLGGQYTPGLEMKDTPDLKA